VTATAVMPAIYDPEPAHGWCFYFEKADLARQFGAELRIVHAVPEALLVARLPGSEDSIQAGVVRGAERLMRSTCREVERKFSVSPGHAVVYGRASHAILEAQSTFDPDLLVIGAKGESNAGPSRSLGGTTLKLLHRCAVPILIVRLPAESHYRRLLIGLGNSAVSGNVLTTARSILNGARCLVVHAFDAPFAERVRALKISEDAADAQASGRQAAQQRQVLAERLAAAKFDCGCELRVLRGNAQAVLLAEIRHMEPDLVILGKHEVAGANHDRHIGSTVLCIAYGTGCDLLHVP
jgi:CPA2 family monovalent cation:H+ antiporter-2